jgi:pimeloyl-ACP methyl ester carboxylesterase
MQGCRVITYDRRGFGKSSKPWVGYNYDTLAADLNILMTKLALKNAVLVGFSMGGGEVARYLKVFGSRKVRKAVFISAIPPFLLKTADNPEGIDGMVFDGIKAALVADRPAFLAQFFSDFYNVDVCKGKRISEEALRLSWNVAAGASPGGTLESVSAWLTDFRKDLSAITIPTLVVHGDSDRIVPINASGKLTHEAIEGSRFIVVKGGPHGLNWTHAPELNRALLDFLGQQAPERATRQTPAKRKR